MAPGVLQSPADGLQQSIDDIDGLPVDGVPVGLEAQQDIKPSGHTTSFSFTDQPAYTPRKLRVVTIGAGFSGLLIAHKFQHQFPELQDIVDHTIYEARRDVGGTWLVNTYPGVQCDVPSHIYVSR